MKMNVDQPKFQVRLIKTVKRKTVDGQTPTSLRYQGASGVIDLARWLGDGSSITTSKSVHEPAGGFAITVPDMPADIGGLDTLYGIVEPMDLIEIRMRRSIYPLNKENIPIVMRGFVSRITRQESMSANGSPQRTITLHGHDYGKVWQMLQLFYGPSYITGQDVLSAFKLMEKFGAGFSNTLTNVEFLRTAIDNLVNPFLANLLPEGSGFPLLDVKADQVVTASVGIAGIQSDEGSVYQLLKKYLDVGIFNELFITEDDNGVYCNYRQNPALDLNGTPLAPEVTTAPQLSTEFTNAAILNLFEIDAADIVSLQVSRSDEGVGNYYWVSAPSFSLNSDAIMRQMGVNSEQRSTVDFSSYPNCASALYGLRLVWQNTQLGGPAVTNNKSGLPEAEQNARDANLFDWVANRRAFLVAQNKDNSLLELGNLRIKGNEKIRAGNYVMIRRGSFSSMFYVSQVSHQMLPFEGFYTNLVLERGQSFSNRIKLAGGVDSPYLAEMIQ
ncbi:hypothetical protein [Pseudomonas sp. Q1]|uniref:hypothetical protein n=1 Tax=Pseudomonas sp. Q1 TaxID=2202823 RepID=UPI001374C22D|nr:hypothetical protein [Pseudomonas sp. Q1]